MADGLFNRIRVVFNSLGNDASDAPQPKASEYVDWLPRHMLRNSCVELKIDSSRPLPGADEDDLSKCPPCLPDQDMVINRIKMLCGMNPFRLSEPTEGHFEKAHANHTLKFNVHFEDREDRSICILHLSVRA